MNGGRKAGGAKVDYEDVVDDDMEDVPDEEVETDSIDSKKDKLIKVGGSKRKATSTALNSRKKRKS